MSIEMLTLLHVEIERIVRELQMILNRRADVMCLLQQPYAVGDEHLTIGTKYHWYVIAFLLI